MPVRRAGPTVWSFVALVLVRYDRWPVDLFREPKALPCRAGKDAMQIEGSVFRRDFASKIIFSGKYFKVLFRYESQTKTMFLCHVPGEASGYGGIRGMQLVGYPQASKAYGGSYISVAAEDLAHDLIEGSIILYDGAGTASDQILCGLKDIISLLQDLINCYGTGSE